MGIARLKSAPIWLTSPPWRQIETIAFNQFEPRIDCRGLKEFALAGGKIVPADDGFAVGKQAVNEVAAYETHYAGGENFLHG